jgi:RNA polymerase sigma factor (sigma-70 family)
MEVTALAARDDGDATLVVRARAGDRDAFAQLVVPRADRVLRTARAILGNESEAHDAAQNAFVSAWVNLARLRDIDRFDAWVNRILRNECRQALRRRRWSRVVEISTVAAEAATVAGAGDPASSIDTAAVQGAFRRLSVDDRTILLLHHLHGLALDEVARQLGIPIGTAKSRLWAARRALERALETER